MKQSAINKIKALHHKVIHLAHVVEATEEEYFREDKEIKKITSSGLLNAICEKCFPFVSDLAKSEHKPAERYVLDYPRTRRVVDGNEWNSMNSTQRKRVYVEVEKKGRKKAS